MEKCCLLSYTIANLELGESFGLLLLKSNAENIDYDKAAEYKKKFRHDVMAHVHSYGHVVPLVKRIIKDCIYVSVFIK